jgi:hypothetical protein
MENILIIIQVIVIIIQILFWTVFEVLIIAMMYTLLRKDKNK